MTLRCEVSIVPYGVEENQSRIYRLDISNQGIVESLGFGHEVCEYKVLVYKKGFEVLGEPDWVLEKEATLDRHDRRDGALKLVQLAIGVIGE